MQVRTRPSSGRSTSSGVRGPVLVVDASCLDEVVTGTTPAGEIVERLRGSDAVDVAPAEALGATLLTSDGRLGRVGGLPCPST